MAATSAEIRFCAGGGLGRANKCIHAFTLAAQLFTFVRLAAPQHLWGPHWELTNGAPDAFLHSAYAALLTLRYGAKFARSLTDAHEAGTPQKTRLQRNARKMDLHNNRVGIAGARSIGRLGMSGADYLHNGITRNYTEALVFQVLLLDSIPGNSAGSELWTLGPPGAGYPAVHRNPTIYSIGTGERVFP